MLFNQDGDEVAVSGILAYRDCGWFAALRQGTRPVDIQGSIHLGKGKLFAVPLEGRGDVAGGLLTVAFLVGGIGRATFKEVTESAVKVAQGLLKGHAGHLIQPRGVCFEEG